jgi:hypothetical protein
MRPRRRTPEVDPFLLAAALANSPFPGTRRLGVLSFYLLLLATVAGLAFILLS